MVSKIVRMPLAISKKLTETITMIGSSNYPVGISLCGYGVDADGVEYAIIPYLTINVNINNLTVGIAEIKAVLKDIITNNELNTLAAKFNNVTVKLYEVIPDIFQNFAPNNNFPKPAQLLF